MNTRRLLTSLFVLLVAVAGGVRSAAAQGTINGTVTDELGAPVIGASVQVVDTDIGALTDARGQFSLSAPSGTQEVRVQVLGFSPTTRTIEVTAGQTTTIEIRLTVRAIELGEIVVALEAGDTRRAEIGTDVERFDAELAVDEGAVQNLSDLLNSRATSLAINASSGSTGAASTVRVRGSSSITQDNNPLIYIDGVRATNGTGTGPGSFDFGNGQTISRLDDIDPQQIADVQVVKGPTAAALYGSEAGAGVILITTKRGRVGQHQFNFSIDQGVNSDGAAYPDNYYNLTSNAGVTDVSDPRFQAWSPVQNPATGEVFARHNPMRDPRTDPRRDGHTQRYSANVRGGGDAVTYFSSFSYDNERGTLRNNDLQRYNFRANLGVAANDEIDLQFSTGFISSDIRLPDNDRSAVGMLTNAGAGLPFFSHGWAGGGGQGECLATIIGSVDSSACAAREGNLTANFDKLSTIENRQQLGRFLGSATINWRPLSWLSGRGTVGMDYVQTENSNLVPLDPDRPFGSNSNGLINDARTTGRTITTEAALTARTDINENISSSTTVGAQYFASDTEIVGCSGEGGFASPTAIACNASLTFSGLSDKVENKEAGAYLQQRFGYRDYLYVTGAVRVDDNSAFGANQNAIVSPSANLSAVISDMPFWNVDWVSDFRFRFAWGKAAQAPSPFAQARTFRPVRLDDGTGNQLTGISPLDPGNPDLAPERNEEFEVGFDAGFLDDRLSLNLTYFNQTTTDAIVPTNVAPSTGFSGIKFVNIGQIENDGLEASINGLVVDNNSVRWDVTLKMSTSNPVVTDLGGQPTILFGLGADHQMFREGFSPGAYWANVVESAERAADGTIVDGSVVLAPGNVGPNGGADPDNPNHRFLGHAEPTNEQSLSTSVTVFSNLRIFTLFDRAAGHSKFDLSTAFRSPFIQNITGSREFAFRQAEATAANQAAMEMGGDTRTGVFIYDADFIKWRELTVTYTFPASFVQKIGPIDALSLSLGGRNLVTFTDYPGLDPELRFDGGRDSFNAAEFFTQPPVRYFFARVNFSL